MVPSGLSNSVPSFVKTKSPTIGNAHVCVSTNWYGNTERKFCGAAAAAVAAAVKNEAATIRIVNVRMTSLLWLRGKGERPEEPVRGSNERRELRGRELDAVEEHHDGFAL